MIVTKDTFDKLRQQVISAYEKMRDIGYDKNNLIVIFNQKYKTMVITIKT